MTKGNIVHIEIPTNNSENSGKFYSELFGWKISTMPELNYTTWEPDAQPGGGFSDVGPDMVVGEVLIYVDSDDIEADLQKAVQLGGKLVAPKTEIPGTGWFGIFKDPTGNKIALYTSRNSELNKR